ncbi:glycoside hydrolase family 57 [Methanohalobium evestigatum Z-7303]|uniref:Glycoside hydrolase family 57 n=1 Tax=Methanohalobium evestigatum (strain ATCC BAA-1072 / DSM 3721 / NBRC 107634 / OCM 161 / Z-7303) TaxID=644295 RepID=D7E9B7_METEZ|nr:glycoside hydrolase family 57 protein [Methanohalobium evestigatum]ADI74189.1 glycoside hydrolase family 57 [Methanohalobium evestigatum Z-7303]
MKSVCFCGEVHLPLNLKWYWPAYEYTKPSIDKYFDLPQVYSSFDKIGYDVIRTNEVIKESIENGGKYSFNISGTFIDICKKWNFDVIKSFKELSNTEKVEFTSSSYYHSLSSLYNDSFEFRDQIKKHRNEINNLFEQNPQTFIDSELILTTHTGSILQDQGFECIISEGSSNLLDGTDPVYVYNNQLPILLRHINLSEDIETRFSDRSWTGYPLIPDKFASWINNMEGDVVVIYFNYDTLARHHENGSNIFQFLKELPESLKKYDIKMETPSEAVKKHQKVKLDNLNIESTARFGMDSLTGNHMQNLYLCELMGINKDLQKIKESPDYNFLKQIYGYLQQSDIFLDMNYNNLPLAYERGVNNFSIISDFRRAVIEEAGQIKKMEAGQ